MADENALLKVKYEYINGKGQQVYSNEFEVPVNLDPDSFQENITNISKTCTKFKTMAERIYYHMFDPEKETFITKSEELKSFVTNKKTIVMKNYSDFAKQIIEILREEETRYKLGKNVDIKEYNRIETNTEIDEKKKNKILNIISNLKLNYFEVDMFAEEFISFEGIKYLISFLQHATGNLRAYSIDAFSKLLEFQSSSDYIQKRKEIIDSLYEILIKTDAINCNLSTLNTLIAIISQDEEKAMYVIDVAEKYAKKSVTRVFSQIITLLSTKEIKLKTKTLFFINILLNFCDSFRLPKLIIEFKEAGIYETLEKEAKTKDANFQEQLTNFQMKTGKIICGSDYELEVYKKQLQEMKQKCQEMEEKYENTIENYYMYEKIVEELLTINTNTKIRKKFFYPQAPIERVEYKQSTPSIKYDKNGIFDLVSMYKDNKNLEHVKKLEDYCNLNLDFKKLVEDNAVLESKQKELIDAKIRNIEEDIKYISNKKDEIKKENEFLEKRIKQLEEVIAKGDFSKDNNKSASTPTSMPEDSKENKDTPIPPTPIAPPPPPPPPTPPGVPPPPGIPTPPGVPSPPGIPTPPGVPLPPGPPGVPTFNAIKVPQPTKPKIKLKIKVKPIQWQRVLLLPENDPKRPDLVWNKITEPDIDIDEITSLFAIKKKEKETTEKLETKPIIVKKNFLDNKRAQEVGISIAKLPSVDIIAKALINMDEKALTEDKIDSLLLIAITKEEYSMYKSMGSDGVWEKNEKYLIELNDVPYYKEKLKVWSTILKYDFLIPRLEESFKYLIPACEEIKNNEHFHEILGTILSLGNIMNGGTSKGQADGFSLDLLPKLEGLKDSTGNSILKFICTKTNKEDPSFEGFKNKFPNLEKAATYSLNETKKKVDELNNMVNIVDKLLIQIKVDDEFVINASNSLRGAKAKVDIFKSKEEKNRNVYHETIKFFGYKDSDKYYDENGLFFKMLLKFFNEVDKEMPKLDVKRVLDYENRVVGKRVDQSKLMNNLMSQLRQRIKG